MLSAFPLDGGHLAKNLLTPRQGSRRATEVTVKMGYGVVAGLILAAALFHSSLLVVPGVVLFAGGHTEKALSGRLIWLEGYQAKDATDRNFVTLPVSATVADAVAQFTAATEPVYVIVTDACAVAGVVAPEQLLKIHRMNCKPLQLQHIMDTDVEVWPSTAPLPEVCACWQRELATVYPVAENGKVVGLLRADRQNEFSSSTNQHLLHYSRNRAMNLSLIHELELVKLLKDALADSN